MNSNIYRQADSRWGSLPYPTKNYTFAHNGCGCCAVTHCVIELEKYKNYTPATVRKYMVQFATQGHGTTWAGITKGLQNYGYNVHYKQSDSMSDIWKVLNGKSLKRGVILFGSTKGPDGTVWTTGGHYIAFVNYKVENGKHYFYLKDSGGRHRDKWWCYEKSMKGDVRQVWICTSVKDSSNTDIKPTTKPTTKYTGTIPSSTIKNGSSGTAVKYLQKFLNWYGGYKLSVDGKCGSKTVAAIMDFQTTEGITADGIYGKNSYAKAKAYAATTTTTTTSTQSIGKCIDVSAWQGKISVDNWKKIKKTCDYAICRASYTSLSKFALNQDSTFVTNFNNAKKAGLKVGAYHFSQAKTVAEAKKEAKYLCDILDKVSGVNFWVACDYETNAKGRLNGKTVSTKASDIANAFCDIVKARGYQPCIYGNYTMMTKYCTKPNYPVWLAQYNSTCDYKKDKVLWQYTSSGKVSGISGNVDLSYVYRGYL